MRVDRVRISKQLSLALRHDPQSLGITLDRQGWANVDDVLRGLEVSADDLEEVVRTSDKQRFVFSPDGLRIRANQGHSVDVELDLPRAEPPEILFHGTSTQFADSIRAQGLIRGARTHVHLSADEKTAQTVASRRKGPHVLLRVRAKDLHRDGHPFFLSENGVWLTTHVPPSHLEWPG